MSSNIDLFLFIYPSISVAHIQSFKWKWACDEALLVLSMTP